MSSHIRENRNKRFSFFLFFFRNKSESFGFQGLAGRYKFNAPYKTSVGATIVLKQLIHRSMSNL